MEEPFHLQYEKQVVLEHASRYKQTTWHNHLIPEDVYHASGYINDWNKHRLERIIRNNRKKKKSLLLGDYGIDFISYDPVEKTYHAGQAKCYENARVTAKACVTFTNTVCLHMRTTGYLYTSKNNLEAYLRENIQASRGLLVHEVLPLDDKYKPSPQGFCQQKTSQQGFVNKDFVNKALLNKKLLNKYFVNTLCLLCKVNYLAKQRMRCDLTRRRRSRLFWNREKRRRCSSSSPGRAKHSSRRTFSKTPRLKTLFAWHPCAARSSNSTNGSPRSYPITRVFWWTPTGARISLR